MRQGDVWLKPIASLPGGLKEKDKTLAYGEVTGHSHRFESPHAKVLVDVNGNQFVTTEQECELIHEEHENVSVPKGNYKVVPQREFDLIEGTRQVLD